MAEIFTIGGLISLLTLILLEIILGIDNIIFISLVTSRLPQNSQAKARNLGISLAIVLRVLLLVSINYVIKLSVPLFSIFELEISIRDLILIFGGLFLIYKSVGEINHKINFPKDEMEQEQENVKGKIVKMSFGKALIQILLLDLVFSIDSILTAIGIGENIEIMVIAVIISMLIMLVSAKAVSEFINKNPSTKILALAFLMMIGVILIAEGFHQEISKGYIYTSMFFALAVEVMNLRVAKKRTIKNKN
jgi:predicted tellurium resistance membrane protein TerC